MLNLYVNTRFMRKVSLLLLTIFGLAIGIGYAQTFTGPELEKEAMEPPAVLPEGAVYRGECAATVMAQSMLPGVLTP